MYNLNPAVHCTGSYWHVFVPGLQVGQLYGYRVRGPYQPERGLRFDASRLILDPTAAAHYGAENPATAMKCVVVDPDRDNWEGDGPFASL